MRKKVFISVLLALLLLSNGIFAASVSQKKINGSSVNIVTVDLNEDVRLQVAKNNDKLVGAEPFTTMVNTYLPDVAINANFFDAYKSLEPYGTIIKGGKVIHMVGNSASLMVYDKKKVHFETLTLKYNGYLDGIKKNYWDNEKNAMSFNVFNIWYVNTNPTDTTGVYQFTNYRNKDIVVNGGYAIEVVNDKVTKVYSPNGKIVIPKDGYVIYYGKDACDKNYIDQRFRIGRKVSLELVNQEGNTSFKVRDKEIPYDSITEMISAGPMLVSNGKNVSAETKKAFKEAKITSNNGARSAIGITKDNKLLFVTTGATIDHLAKIMLELGAVDAMNLDGGASSAMYANKKMIRPAGRNLNTIFMATKIKKSQNIDK